MQRTFYTICELSEKEKHDILRKYVPDIDMNKFKSEIESLKNKNFVLKQTIKEISVENTELEEKLLEQAQQIQELANKNQGLTNRNQELANKNQGLTNRNQELANKNQGLINRNQELANKNQGLTNRNQELANKNQGLTNRNQELANKNQELANKNQEKDKIIAALRTEIERLKANASQPAQRPVSKQLPVQKSKPAQMLSDKELVVKEITDSWEEIIKSINNGTYRYKYQIGNYKPLSFGGLGTVNMQIAAFDADELSDGSGKALVTWISKEILTQHRMNPRYSVGGWEYSEMRKFLEDEIRPLIPEKVRNAIKTVKKYTYTSDYKNGRKQQNGITEDALWIPSLQEIFGYFSEDEASAVYYNVLFSNNALRVKTYNKNAAWWWLRSANYTSTFYFVYTDGSNYYNYATSTGGVALGFCM